MFKWYKEKQKQKSEKIIQSHIDFNRCQTEKYKTLLNEEYPINRYAQEPCIAKCYSINFLNLVHKKYNVDKELIDLVVKSQQESRYEYRKMEIQIQQIKNDNEEKERIRLYKKAILELKNEGKI